MDLGVDGFRCDAVQSLVEHGEFPDEPRTNTPGYTEDDRQYLQTIYEQDQPETYDVIYEWRQFVDAYSEKNGGISR